MSIQLLKSFITEDILNKLFNNFYLELQTLNNIFYIQYYKPGWLVIYDNNKQYVYPIKIKNLNNFLIQLLSFFIEENIFIQSIKLKEVKNDL